MDKFLYATLSTFEAGLNSDLAPSLLAPNVLSWAINATVRGGFPRPRPPLFRRELVFPNAEVQAAVETGFFQGAGYYRPDFGPSQLVAQISGRLFTFTPGSAIANDFVAAEITIPGDANDPTTNQVWMWQAEKWLIITDGTAKLPIFYDGVSARRSLGPAILYGNATAVDLPGPNPIGTVITLTLAAPYTGPFNVAVLFNGEYYQTLESPAVDPDGAAIYRAQLTNLQETPGTLIPAGANAVVQPGFLGTVTSQVTKSNYLSNEACQTQPFAPPGNDRIVYFTTTITVPRVTAGLMDDAGTVRFFNPSLTFLTQPIWTVTGGDDLNAVSSPTVTRILQTSAGCFQVNSGVAIGFNPSLNPGEQSPGNFILDGTNTAPNVIIGKTALDFTVPAVNSNVIIQLTAPYTGPENQLVWINNVPYLLSPPPPLPPAGNTLSLINLTDTGAIVIPGDVLSISELPAGRMGAYGLGHVAMSLVDGISFIYGDTVGGPSGTPATNYRDSVLRTTENDFMVGGGSFRIPNSGEIITSMTFTAILDAAFGQGPLLLGTPTSIFTCAVPTDRALWVALTNPVLTQALIGKGPLAQNSTIPANSDTLFRSSEGIGSLIFGRRDFETWGNTPISSEMARTVSRDIRSLLSYGSAVQFDNRFLSTAAPQVANQGVYHIGTLALNFDPVSSLRGKAPSIWESLWVGTNVLQYVVGRFGAEERCFQFTFNERTEKMELYEQLRSDSAEVFDHGTDRIGWTVETPCIYKPQERPDTIPIVRLVNGKIHLSEIVGTVHVKVSWRPDYYPLWAVWHETDYCAEVNPNDPTSQRGYRTMGLGEPPAAVCEAANNRVLRSGRFHQVRLDILGQCVVNGMEFAAVPEPSITFPSPDCCTIVSDNIQPITTGTT